MGKEDASELLMFPIKSLKKDGRVSSKAGKHSSTSRNVSTSRQSKQLCMFNYHKFFTTSAQRIGIPIFVLSQNVSFYAVS